MTPIQQLCYLQGIALEYNDYFGQQQYMPQHVREQLLRAAGHQIDDEQTVNDTNFSLDAAPWQQVLAKFQVCAEQKPEFKVRVAPNSLSSDITVVVTDEQSNVVVQHNFVPEDYVETGNYVINETRYSERAIELPTLCHGYYNIALSIQSKTWSGTLLVSPQTAYNPIHSQKLWGLSVQLYSVNSDTNLGVGDFNDLQNLIRHSAQSGASYILLNPLHKLFSQDPECASPYSPSDRMQINPLYISGLLCDDIKIDNHSLTPHEPGTTYINYTAVWQSKYALFERMFAAFKKQHLQTKSPLSSQFTEFCSQYADWHLSEFEFYLQWQAQQQLAKCQQLALSLGMKIGLMFDLAVGCNPNGEEFKRNKALFCNAVNIGAPPDPFALDGQNWGLPAPNPIAMKQSQFAHFISLLRQNMQFCGALRIDHIMAILRLWWCVNIDEQQVGGYVYYPMAELLAILKVESHRNQCVIIGEDLGVVPEPISEALSQNQMLGNDIFYFEKNDHGAFKPLPQLRSNILLMLANHDVAPFYAWWQKADLALKKDTNLYASSSQYDVECSQREYDKKALLNWLDDHFDESDTETVFKGVITKLAISPANLLCIQLDDLDQAKLPMNIPGTDREYPNWRRRFMKPLATLFEQNADLLSAINKGRKHAKA